MQDKNQEDKMKVFVIFLYIFAFIGIIFISNLTHESYHYFSIRNQPNVTVEHFCAAAIPIPENNYSEVGFILFTYSGKKPIDYEWIAITIGYLTTFSLAIIWRYLDYKDL